MNFKKMLNFEEFWIKNQSKYLSIKNMLGQIQSNLRCSDPQRFSGFTVVSWEIYL